MTKSGTFGCLIGLSAALWLIGAGICLGFVPRTGFVTLQYDDTHDYDYTRIFPKLEQYGYKGSFGYITESSELGILHDSWKIEEMYSAGHEIQDHTTRHDLMWATHVDTLDDGIAEWIPTVLATEEQWDSLCHRSLQIMRSLGIEAAGWNQPGGGCVPGEIPGHPEWSSKNDTSYALYDLIAKHYSYMIGFRAEPTSAHVNLHWANCPDRFPLFNVPHVTIDAQNPADVRTGVADAVASGLWYIALSHSYSLENVCKAESLVDWLAGTDIEVLTCKQGVERIQWGYPDPAENQFPQAAMTHDRDGNGKPDGFTSDCVRDTVSAPPIPGVKCCEVSGNVEFYCYGPFVGSNAFSLWVKSATDTACSAWLAYSKRTFEGGSLGDTWTALSCQTEWTRADTLWSSNFSIDVDDEVDHIKFRLSTLGKRVLIAYPEMMYVYETAGSPGDRGGAPALITSPNPVCLGAPLLVRAGDPAARISVYDVLGRCLASAKPAPGRSDVTFDTAAFPPGVLFVRDSSAPSRRAKIVAYR
ncbi:MAG: polysaccharide deacetylase family protein [bacterium]